MSTQGKTGIVNVIGHGIDLVDVAEMRRWIEDPRDPLIPRCFLKAELDVNGGAKLVHPGGAKLVHLTLRGTRCWGVVPVVHRRDPRCFV